MTSRDRFSSKRVNNVHSNTKINRDTTQKISNPKEREKNNSNRAFKTPAQEIYSSVSNFYDELFSIPNGNLNSISFSTIHLKPESKFNNIDLKRHQDYFNQMMNFDTPSGSWIDINT